MTSSANDKKLALAAGRSIWASPCCAMSSRRPSTTECWNAGPDARSLAARLSRLDILLEATGEKDVELGREVAARARGLCRVIHGYRDVSPAVSEIFAGR